MSATRRTRMTFPEWTTKGRASKQKVASNRLRYMISRLAAEVGPKNTVKSIADEIKVDYSTICVYIIKGKFSESVADKLEARFGATLAPSYLLQDPLAE